MSKLKENQILVMIKEPGQDPWVDPLCDNTLEAFQEYVDGYIEPVQIFSDVVLLVNEEGLIRGLPYNITLPGGHVHLFGNIVAVGVKGDEFCSLKPEQIPLIEELLYEQKYN